ncbi:MAG: hypothetical protein M3017_07790 [Actinomycetota bacterium]|nr:hypothetical protein [Actinomycetota bacterium]
MSTGKPRRYIVRSARVAAGTVMAAATLAAVTAFSSAASAPPASATSASETPSRIMGVHADMERAVALRQVTPEQASRFEQQLIRRIQADA